MKKMEINGEGGWRWMKRMEMNRLGLRLELGLGFRVGFRDRVRVR